MTMLPHPLHAQWFTLSDPGMEEAFFDTPLCREFAQLKTIRIRVDDAHVSKAFDENWVARCHADRFVQTLDLVRRCAFGRIDPMPNSKFKAWHA